MIQNNNKRSNIASKPPLKKGPLLGSPFDFLFGLRLFFFVLGLLLFSFSLLIFFFVEFWPFCHSFVVWPIVRAASTLSFLLLSCPFLSSSFLLLFLFHGPIVHHAWPLIITAFCLDSDFTLSNIPSSLSISFLPGLSFLSLFRPFPSHFPPSSTSNIPVDLV